MTLYENIFLHLKRYGHSIHDIIWVGNSKQHMKLSFFWDFAQKHDLKSVYKIPDDFIIVGSDFWLSKKYCDDDFYQDLFDCWKYNKYPQKPPFECNEWISFFSPEEIDLLRAEFGIPMDAKNSDFFKLNIKEEIEYEKINIRKGFCENKEEGLRKN